MMRKITFVTRNARKFEEARLILSDFEIQQLDVSLVEIQGEPEAIVLHKIEEARKHIDPPFFIDDTFLCFTALHGLPGAYINAFSTKLGPEGLFRLLHDFDDKSADAVAMIGCLLPGEQPRIFEGRLSGTIVSPRGVTAFGWDPIFQPLGSGQTFAEMGIDGKSKVSHRKKALEEMKRYLQSVV